MEIGMEENYGWNMVEEGWRKGPWTAEEDRLLIEYVKIHGEGRWTSVAKLAGLKRNGKSCRLRWVNYLRPDLKRGKITPNEERIILEMHAIWGNRWSIIARSLPGRTDNEIKNYWRTHFKKVKTGNGNMDDESKARMLRMQQFHHHHQYQYQQQQHHQQQQLMQQTQQAEDMQRIMSMMLDDNDSDTNTAPSLLPQIKLDSSGFICYGSNTPDEIGLLYSMINDYAETEPETTIHDHDHDTPSSDGGGIVWDGSWNIDDGFNGNINYSTL